MDFEMFSCMYVPLYGISCGRHPTANNSKACPQEKDALAAQLKSSRDCEQQDRMRQDLEKLSAEHESLRSMHRSLIDASKQLGRKSVQTASGKKALETAKTWVERMAPVLQASEERAKAGFCILLHLFVVFIHACSS
jgi:uncharacterized protein (DUF3084 family)